MYLETNIQWRSSYHSHKKELLKYKHNVLCVRGEEFLSTVLKYTKSVILWHLPADLCINACSKGHGGRGDGGLAAKSRLILVTHGLESLLCSTISQARVVEWVAISFSRGSSHPRGQTLISFIAGEIYTTEPPGTPPNALKYSNLMETKVFTHVTM